MSDLKMSFAKRQMEAMGWREGMGLGANEDGIRTAIKPKLKFNNSGIGYEEKEWSNQWWNQSFNCSANYVDFKIKMTSSGLKVSHKSEEDNKESPKSNKYSNFIKSDNKSKLKESNDSLTIDPKIGQNIDFDEVFRKSGGRTAHKGSRHGIKMSAKLKRIEEQNNEFIKKFKKLKNN